MTVERKKRRECGVRNAECGIGSISRRALIVSPQSFATHLRSSPVTPHSAFRTPHSSRLFSLPRRQGRIIAPLIPGAVVVVARTAEAVEREEDGRGGDAAV